MASDSPLNGTHELIPDALIEFTIGNSTLRARPLSLWDLQVCREDINSIKPGMHDWDYAAVIIRLVARLSSPLDTGPDVIAAKAQVLMQKCSVKDIRGLFEPFGKLLELSGFESSGEAGPTPAAQAPIPGTGTSTESSQNLPEEESAVETQQGSSAL